MTRPQPPGQPVIEVEMTLTITMTAAQATAYAAEFATTASVPAEVATDLARREPDLYITAAVGSVYWIREFTTLIVGQPEITLAPAALLPGRCDGCEGRTCALCTRKLAAKATAGNG